MQSRQSLWIGRLVLACAVVLAARSHSRAGETARSTAFVGARVVPMDTERVLEDHTVVVEHGRITAIGPSATVAIPAGADVIDAAGRYLMPGLADMHTHLTGEAPFVEGADQLPHYIAEGVTTIRLLSAAPGGLALRDEIERGERIGPTIYSAGHTVVGMPDFLFLERYKLAAAIALLCLLVVGAGWLVAWLALRARRDGPWPRIKRFRWPSLAAAAALGVALVMTKVVPINLLLSRVYPWVHVVESPDQARAVVRSQAKAGYDLIKIYDYLTEETALAALDEAHRQGMYPVGHISDLVPLELLLDHGLREIAHVDELMERHMLGKAGSHGGFSPVPLNYETIPETVELLASHDVFVVSNMVADEVTYQLLEDPEGWLQRPEYAHASPSALERWSSEGRAVNWQGQQEWRRNTLQPFLLAMIGALGKADVKLLVGTDVSVEGMMPVHLHRELELLVEAGLSPYQALEAATKNAGSSVARMGKDDSFGTIEVGKRADLLLLEQSPLADVSATRHRVGVMVRGRWFPQEALDMRSASLAAR